MSTPTPRTDAHEAHYIPNIIDHPDAVYCVPVHVARELERELAAARAEVEQLEKGLVNQDLLDERNELLARVEKAEAEVERLSQSHLHTLNAHGDLMAEVAALREDKARLDWLAKGDTYGKLSSVRLSLPTAFYPTPIAHDCIRAAIDAARKEQP